MSLSPYSAPAGWGDLGRVSEVPARRAYGLRSASTPDGWVSSTGYDPSTGRAVRPYRAPKSRTADSATVAARRAAARAEYTAAQAATQPAAPAPAERDVPDFRALLSLATPSVDRDARRAGE